jgi:phosphate acetyltransferase
MSFIESVIEKLRRHPKRIVFPEGTEPRILHAARRCADLKAMLPILLGDKDEIQKLAASEKVDLDHIMIIDPKTASDLPVFCANLERLDRYKRMGITNPRDLMVRPYYFGAMMLQYGQADALVGGANAYTGTLLRPLFQLIKPLPGVRSFSSAMMVELEQKQFGENGVLYLADCGVIPHPTVEQLAHIAFGTGQLARQLSGITPRVAMLSFSTKGSAKTPEVERVIAATALARKLAEDSLIPMEIDGELQADTALDPELASRKAPKSLVAGRANVLVFPDLNSGNIASKLIRYLAGARTYGQILLGLSKPAADLSRGSTVDDIVGVAAIVGLQAVEYRKLYPEEPLQ